MGYVSNYNTNNYSFDKSTPYSGYWIQYPEIYQVIKAWDDTAFEDKAVVIGGPAHDCNFMFNIDVF